MVFKANDPDICKNGRVADVDAKEEPERLQEIKASELRAAMRRLRAAVPSALRTMVEAMDNPEIPEKDRIKYCKDVYDLYLKTVGMDMALKKAKAAIKQGKADQEETEEKVKPPAVVFTLQGVSIPVLVFVPVAPGIAFVQASAWE